MVVGVEIAEAHPFPHRHSAQVWVSGPTESIGNLGESSYQAFEFGDVTLEINRPGSSLLLIEFARRLETFWPSDRNPEASPFQEFAGIGEARRSRRDSACIEFEGVVQVADHLVRGHFSPETRGGWRYEFEAGKNLGDLLTIAESLHRLLGAEQICSRHTRLPSLALRLRGADERVRPYTRLLREVFFF